MKYFNIFLLVFVLLIVPYGAPRQAIRISKGEIFAISRDSVDVSSASVEESMEMTESVESVESVESSNSASV
uniref:Secreted protein n=1 Tax=Parastrongyloides trichosuri TaxID=131310 RepID=A0A0N4Z5Z3_PARTI